MSDIERGMRMGSAYAHFVRTTERSGLLEAMKRTTERSGLLKTMKDAFGFRKRGTAAARTSFALHEESKRVSEERRFFYGIVSFHSRTRVG